MNYMKNMGKSILLSMIVMLLLTLLMAIFSYVDVLKPTGVTIFKIIIPIISLFLGGFTFGKSREKKGWLEGLKLGGFFLLLLFLINIFLHSSFEMKNFLYFGILLISCVFGSMIGINQKKKDSK